MFTLNNLRKHPKSTHRRKVVGRGLGSGKGTYSTRGGKGQTARTGHSKMPVGFEGGRQPIIRQLPKNRGFRSLSDKAVVVRLDKLAKAFPAGGTVNLLSLREKKLIASTIKKVKIVDGGKISVTLKVAVPASKTATAAILAAGGSVK